MNYLRAKSACDDLLGIYDVVKEGGGMGHGGSKRKGEGIMPN